jgi:hypothetical protein
LRGPLCTDSNETYNDWIDGDVRLAIICRYYHLAGMPYRPRKLKKPEPKSGVPGNPQSHADQHSDLRRRDMITRSTLSRLRNRKSDLK